MCPTIVLLRKEVINQAGYPNQFSLLCFSCRKAHQATKGRGAADMPSETPSNVYSTCHGNQVILAVPSPAVCSVSEAYFATNFGLPGFRVLPLREGIHPFQPDLFHPNLGAFPNEPIHLCLVTI